MAVFTAVSRNDVDIILDAYAIGDFHDLQPISQGIENTNYFLETKLKNAPGTDISHFVLTIFENLSDKDIPFFNQMTRHLAAKGFSVPAPVLNSSSQDTFRIGDKTGVIVPRLKGAFIQNPEPAHCARIGAWMASMHLAFNDFEDSRPLVRDMDWMSEHLRSISDQLSDGDRVLLEESIDRYRRSFDAILECPQGIVHGDLFRDNVLFVDEEITGVIDFYNASNACLLYDLAVAANDWATNQDGTYDRKKLESMTRAYQEVRPWGSNEIEIWPYMLELAALRFWISRLVSKYGAGYQNAALAGQALKDPNEMKSILLAARAYPN